MPKTVYEQAGDQVRSLEDFYRVIGEVINVPGGYFGSNLNALIDCLRGSFGTPDDGITIRWLRSEQPREALSYYETVRQLELRLLHCHPTGREQARHDLALARDRTRPTVIEWLVDIIQEEDGVDLELA